MNGEKDAQYTDIEIIVFSDEDGQDIEMEVIDEFDWKEKHYIALRPPIDPMNEDSDEDSIVFFHSETDADGEEIFDLVEDNETLLGLTDKLEERLLAE